MQQNTTEISSMENQTSNMVMKRILIICAAVLTVLLIIYIGFSVYFMNHFYVGTQINSVDVSGVSVEEAKDRIQQAMKEYQLVLVERDGSEESIFGKEIDLQVIWENQVDRLMEEQNGFLWVKSLFFPVEFEEEVQMTYDEDLLLEKINSLSCMAEDKQVEPQNAFLSSFEAGKRYEVVPSVPGTLINQEMLQQKISEGLYGLKAEISLVDEFCYVEPEIADDNETLLNQVAELNKVLDTVITYQIGSNTEILDSSVFETWVYLDENKNICINEDEIAAYVKTLASKYNTYYSKKTLMTSYGIEVVIKNSYYGWKVDNAAEREAIKAELLAGEAVTRDLHYSMEGNSRDGNDYGNSYVEINLTAQHLYMYVDGELIVESDFVSGDLSKGWSSPTGAFSLTYRDKDAVLNGDTYSTPVTYWMPFAGNVGMHDATWRDEFGASIYKRDGSHGCINLPKDKAEIIFKNIRKGFPVLCYELEGTQSEEGIAQDQAYKVIDSIKAIEKNVTLNSEKAIQKARTQYEALSDLAKTYVTNYNKLVKAEQSLAKLQAAQKTAVQ